MATKLSFTVSYSLLASHFAICWLTSALWALCEAANATRIYCKFMSILYAYEKKKKKKVWTCNGLGSPLADIVLFDSGGPELTLPFGMSEEGLYWWYLVPIWFDILLDKIV